MRLFTILIVALLLPASSYAGAGTEPKRSGGIRIAIEVKKPAYIASVEETASSGKKTPTKSSK